MGHALIDTLLNAIYPPQCAACGEATDEAQGLCGTCWAKTPFISGLVCTRCGIPLVGEAEGGEDGDLLCDGCLHAPPAWDRGAAAVLYDGTGRRVALALKHGDRLDLAKPLARWMARVGRDLIAEAEVVAPVPLHWSRLVRRQFNQAAELARQRPISGRTSLVPDLLNRNRATRLQDGLDREERFANQRDAFEVNPKRAAAVQGRRVLLIDDVMTSGATLSACAEALRQAGAGTVNVLVLARVARQ